jgi:hypothetical protein
MAGSSFHHHPHPQGEEILVLDGVFSDWRGDHKAGTLLLNPEGFEHAPYSAAGCEVFVRLRQYAGTDRPQLAIDSNALDWVAHPTFSGVELKHLFGDASRWSDSAYLQRYVEHTHIEAVVVGIVGDADVALLLLCARWEAGTVAHETLTANREVFVLDGEVVDIEQPSDDALYATATWIRFPTASVYHLKALTQCTLFIRDGLSW